MLRKRIHRVAFMLSQGEVHYLWVDFDGEILQEGQVSLEKMSEAFPQQWRRPETTFCVWPSQLDYCEKIIPAGLLAADLEAEIALEFPAQGFSAYVKTPLDSEHDFFQSYSFQGKEEHRLRTVLKKYSLKLKRIVPEWQSLIQFLQDQGKAQHTSFGLQYLDQNQFISYRVFQGKVQRTHPGALSEEEHLYDFSKIDPELSLVQKILRGSVIYD